MTPSTRTAIGPDRSSVGFVGRSRLIRELEVFIDQIAPSDFTVVVEGPSGTGKELVARALHARSRRSGGPFVAINCAALPEALLESELFGHEKGAFTGAHTARRGRFESAGGGTLFLDEVAELPLGLQSKLLRALEAREIDRVGGHHPVPVDIRLVAATNRDLETAMDAGEFRSDLYYRLQVLIVRTPSLAEHPGDIPDLAQHFVSVCASRSGHSPTAISSEAMAILEGYRWPGNVRELRNAIEHALAVSGGGLIAPEHLPRRVVRGVVRPRTYHEALDETKRRLFESAFSRARGDYKKAARLLGLHPHSVHRLLQRLDLAHLLKTAAEEPR